jgi:signal transduction histidine kinase
MSVLGFNPGLSFGAMGGDGVQQRRLEVMAALNRAGLAAARTEAPEAIYASVAESLRDAGFFASIYSVEGEFARLVQSSFGDKAVKVVERHTQLRLDDFRVKLEDVPFFRHVMRSEEAQLFDTAEVLSEVFPPNARWLAGPVARVIKIRRGIGAAVRNERGDPVALLFLLGNELSTDDVSTASVFAQLLGVTLGRLRITRELEQNVAALKKAQEQLVHAQKIEAIGRLTGGIAHDFNNLLTPALFAVGELEQPSLTTEQTENVDIIRQTLERCADLTRSLLAFGRRQVLARRRVLVDDAVGSALRLLRATFQELVRLEWAPNAGSAVVEADVTQLHQVMINLALNARDAMPNGGVFRVSTRVLPSGLVEIECTDTGTGIPAQTLPRIFEPFFTTKGPGRGTGLGLSVVEGIVHQHGGTIAVDSVPGTGTTFTIQLQQALSEGAYVNSTPLPVASATTGQRLLVVEDDPLVRRTLVRILSSRGYVIVEAASLAQARELRAKPGRFDLVLTDVVLPDGNSTDETVALYLEGQRVVFVTGHPLDANWLPVELSKLPVLQKPFGPAELIAAVEAALR